MQLGVFGPGLGAGGIVPALALLRMQAMGSLETADPRFAPAYRATALFIGLRLAGRGHVDRLLSYSHGSGRDVVSELRHAARER
ncbi:MAG: hypothetical protein ABIM50_13650 [Novosphingobium sp.]